MPSFHYRARDASGRAHEGVEVASSQEEVLRTLSGLQLTPISIELQVSTNGTGRVIAPGLGGLANDVLNAVRYIGRGAKPGSVALFARQLATMISAGLPLVRAMRSIARDHHDRQLARVLDQVADDVQKGESLAASLGRHPHVFDEVIVSLVQTGEVSGTLDSVLEHTASYLERAELLRLRVEASLRYPIFVMTFAVLVFLAMIFKIVPMFSAIYERFRVQLPLPTRMLLVVSQFATRNAALFIGLGALLAVAAWAWARSGPGRLALDGMRLKMPVFGPLIAMYAVTKFSRTLGILVGSGTQILTALRVMRPVPGNKVLERGIDEVRERVQEGVALSRALEGTGVFPDMLVQMAATGEETGKLDQMLMRTADFYEQRVTAKVEGLSSLVEPIAIVILGVVIGAMLVALYLPIFNLGQAMRSGLTGQ